MDVKSLLLNLDGLALPDINRLASEKYQVCYLTEGKFGILEAHDGDKVFFYEDCFGHAFFTSDNRARNPYGKTELAIDRVQRILWIREVISGNVPGSECWSVLGESGPRSPRKRLYVVWNESYVVWLNPRKDGDGWKFVTAYSPSRQEIRRYTQGGQKIWVWKESWRVEQDIK